ncbi:unnamed protein product [Closterium sp. Naga37s-1]|nr:unnamed protein product [Closterium sp. Naga37s-1]
MDRRYGRLSGLCGLVALVAGLVSISFLATHASAADVSVPTRHSREASLAVMECGWVGEMWSVGEKWSVGGWVMECSPSTADDAGAARQRQLRQGPEAQAHLLQTWAQPLPVSSLPPHLPHLPPSTPFPRLTGRSVPLLRTTLELQGNSRLGGRNRKRGKAKRQQKQKLTFSTIGPADALGGSSACSDLTSSIAGSAKITVVWRASKFAAAGDGMCYALNFYSGTGCSGQATLTIVRPARTGVAFPVTKRCVSVMHGACVRRGTCVMHAT